MHLHDHLAEEQSVWLFAGLSRFCSAAGLPSAYTEAREMSGYSSKEEILRLYDEPRFRFQEYYYPENLASQLKNSIIDGKKQEISTIFSLIRRENIMNRHISIKLLHCLITEIRNTVLQAQFEMKKPPIDDQQFRNITNALLDDEYLTFLTLEELALLLASSTSPEKGDSNLIQAIVDYIQSNYQDPSLGLAKISDEFHISESYFSHQFKDAMGLNFSTYLENLRLETATQLLKESSFDSNTIASMTGYNSAASFRRAFKKKYGITPGSLTRSSR